MQLRVVAGGICSTVTFMHSLKPDMPWRAVEPCRIQLPPFRCDTINNIRWTAARTVWLRPLMVSYPVFQLIRRPVCIVRRSW